MNKILKFLAELAILLGAAYLMLGLTYYFGWTLLPDDIRWGNDIASAMNNVYYLDHWFPYIPHWIPLWTGGIPFLRLYPPAPFYLTFFLFKNLSFSIDQLAKLILFFSIPLTAAGVVWLGRILTKNWIIGILAGVLMLLSPDSWLWVTQGGFYPLATSAPVFVLTLIFFCLFFETKKGIFFLLTAVSYGLLWLFHPMPAIIILIPMVFMGFGYGIKNYGLKKFWLGLVLTGLIICLGVFLFNFWIFPFLTREEVGGIGLSAEQMYKESIFQLLGLEPVSNFDIGTFFTGSAIVLFFLGSIVIFIRKSILRWAFLACLTAVFIITAPLYAQPLVKKLVLLWSSTNVRSAIILRVFVPIIGAYGAVSLVRPIFWLLEKTFHKLKDNYFWRYGTETIGGFVGIFIFILVLQNVTIKFPASKEYELKYHGYGPYLNWIKPEVVDGKLAVRFPITKNPTSFYKTPREIISEIPEIPRLVKSRFEKEKPESILSLALKKTGVTDKDRIDIAPISGAVSGALNNYGFVNMIPAYWGSSLIQGMWGWQVDCTYWNKTCQSPQVEDLARWWGVKQFWFGNASPAEFQEKFGQSDNFVYEQIKLKSDSSDPIYNWNIYHFKDNTGLASITNKPVLLVIGGDKKLSDAYDTVFKGLTKADFGYKDAWSVQGKQYIDDYALGELQQFEGIVLYGYRYRDRSKAWRLLEKYVSEGGSLLINTGWQYVCQDWGKENQGKSEEILMPKLFPVERTIWGPLDLKWNLTLGENEINTGVTTRDWGEPLWSGQPWGVSSAPKTALKKGAFILLEDNGRILTAGMTFGKGKVVWSGFDFLNHLNHYQANDERLLVHNLFSWLVGGEYRETSLDFERQTPDLINIKYQVLEGNNKLMFKEVASDNWVSLLVQNGKTKDLPIYKAGPGWRVVFLDNKFNSGEVVFKFQKNKVEIMGMLVSILTVIMVIFFLLLRLMGKDVGKITKEKMTLFIEKRKSIISKNWEDDEK